MLRASYTMRRELDVVESATCIRMSVIWVRTGGWQSDSFESCAASQRLARRSDQHPLDHDLCEREPPGTEGLFVTRIGDRRWEIKSVWNLWRVSITDTMPQHAPGPSPHVGRKLATPSCLVSGTPFPNFPLTYPPISDMDLVCLIDNKEAALHASDLVAMIGDLLERGE